MPRRPVSVSMPDPIQSHMNVASEDASRDLVGVVTATIREDVLGWRAYHVPASSGLIKLDAMENPYPLPDEVRREMADAVFDAPVNRYPDPAAEGLKVRLRKVLSLPETAAILLGNGSDEIIQMLCQSVARPGAVVMGVEPSFVMYRIAAATAGMRYFGVPLRSDFSLDEEAIVRAVRELHPALLFLAYPNNPTGNLFDADTMIRIVECAPGLVVIDEAYHAFASRSMMDAVLRYPNVVVMRTLSKLGLAGLRLGLIVGEPAWLAEFDKVRLPYNINVLTQVAATAVLRHAEVLERQAAEIVAQRERLHDSLARMANVSVFRSSANFLTMRVPDAKRIFEGVRERGVLIKNLHGFHPLLDQCVRVTVGTPWENDQFLRALDETIGRHEGNHDGE